MSKKIKQIKVNGALRRLGIKTIAEPPQPNWERIRKLLNAALTHIGLQPGPDHLQVTREVSFDCAPEETMNVAYGISIYWEGLSYSVQRETLIPGVRYTKNGDGWPDDVDVTELAHFSPNELTQTVRFAAERVAEARIDEAIENVLEDEWAKEYQEERQS
jgi:hypothetical protein